MEEAGDGWTGEEGGEVPFWGGEGRVGGEEGYEGFEVDEYYFEGCGEDLGH